ncbi:hypothetical protein PG996_009079 [Apiospora saccharicola]|uniref:Uncharacterized protein n=1 Tax=Apiospora saccharicola TaxID=335842 RepID=A0ABR1UMR5_9PEZI
MDSLPNAETYGVKVSAKNETPLRDDPAILELLYQPLVLEDAMNRVMKGHRDGAGESLGIPTDSMLPSFEAHKCFANKLAQVLDCERGGSTVTALTILKGGVDQLEGVREFLQELLRFVHTNPLRLNPKPLLKKVLGMIIMFNFSRFQAYLNNLRKGLDACIADCRKRVKSQDILELEQELQLLQTRASFPMETGYDIGRSKFLGDCDTLLRAISINKGTRIDDSILQHTDDPNASNLEIWQELRHYLGRLHSYRQAADVIMAANDRWPKLRKASNPFLNRKLGAEIIVRNMLWDDEDPKLYLRQVRGLDRIGLSDEIRDLANKKSFHPIVHAEVQLHAALIQQDLFRSSDFWNGYKYIGCSKPTCRLCSYYFFERGDGIQVRPTHRNIYLHWRLPDVYPGQGRTEERTHRQLLEQITQRVRKDAKLILDERQPSRRKHDSSDRSSIPSLFYPHIPDTASSLGELVSEIALPDVDASAAGSVVSQSFNHDSLGRLVEEDREDVVDIENFEKLGFMDD